MWNLKKKKLTYLQSIDRFTNIENKLIATEGKRGREGGIN